MSAAPKTALSHDEVIAALKSIHDLPGDGKATLGQVDLSIGAAKVKALQGVNNPPQACSAEELTWLVWIATNYDEHGPYRLEALKAYVRGIGSDNVQPYHIQLVMEHVVYSDMMTEEARDYVMTDLLPAVLKSNAPILQEFVPHLKYVSQPPLSTKTSGFIYKGEPMSAFQRLRFSPVMREAALKLLADMGGPMVASWRKLAVPGGAQPAG